MNRKNKNVLITGAAGFIGRNTAKYFKDRGWKVYGLGYGKLSKSEIRKWGMVKWQESEINLNVLRKISKKFDLIIHCAGSGSVGKSFVDPREDFKSNVGSVLEVLEFSRIESKNSKIIILSSPAVNGERPSRPIKESDPLNPVSPYGLHKKIAEELCEFYAKIYGLNVSIIRFFSVYGPGLKKQLLWDACEKMRKGGKIMKFFGTGDETRDWLNVQDVASLIFAVSKSKKNFEIINGGSGKKTKIKKVLEMVNKFYGENKRLKFIGKTKKGDPRYYQADIAKILKLGWSPKINLEDGIKEYVNFYKMKK